MVSSNEGMQDAHANPEEDPDVPPAKRTFSFLNTYTLPRRATPEYTMMETLVLGYQSLGVVYGDIGTSPLYVFSSLKLENPGEQEILGIFSLIFWTLTLMGLVKYVSIVLHADDHGEGGTFALYSLLRQHINFKGNAIMPATRLDSDVKLQFHSKSSIQSKAHKFLEESSRAQVIITYIVLIGTCMVIGDGALTPAISVLSAVQGIQSRSPNITQEHVVLLSVAILLFLFLFQRFGTSKVSFSFSPIMLLWFTFGTGIGVYNIIKFYPPVLKALSPYYIYKLFEGKGKLAWGLLGAIVLSVTGAEAMFADLGHFNKQGIQIAFSAFVYPALILTYGGEAAFLIKNPGQLSTTFYSSVPEPVFWPMFVIATLAAIVASQALISASFSIIRQSIGLGFFPRVTMRHTSIKHEGQVYSPEVNYFLMIVCIIVTCGFKGGVEIGNAFGVAVIWVMLITTFLMAIVMLVIWDTNVILVGFFLVVFVGIEGIYMTALLEKIPQGGWVPFAISAFVLVITLSWSHGRSMKSEYERKNKIDRVELNVLLANNTIPRVDGICFFCTDLTNGIPPIVRHYVQHAGALRKVMIMVTVRILPVKSVLPEERYIVAKLGPTGVYRCLVQYGYMDKLSMEGDEYIYSVIRTLKEEANDYEEIQLLESALDTGAVFVLGRIILKPGEKNGWFKNLIIGTIYRFLQKNFRSSVGALQIPPGKMLQVGMLYEI